LSIRKWRIIPPNGYPYSCNAEKYPIFAPENQKRGGQSREKLFIDAVKSCRYIVVMEKAFRDMTTGELKAELARLKDGLCDLEDMHSFTFGKTSVHIGAEKAQNLQAEFEEECGLYSRKIAEIEQVLRERGIP
jgi:hypothetical protein